MPFIETEQPFAVETPGAADLDFGSESPVARPTWGQTFGAAFEKDNTIGSIMAAEAPRAGREQQEGFSAWEKVKGTEDEPDWRRFTEVRNQAHFDAVKHDLTRERENRRILDAAGWRGDIAQMVAGTVDVPLILPGGQIIRGAKGGVSILRSAANVAAATGLNAMSQEAVLQATQQTRTAAETGLTVGASVLLGGLLGAGGAKLLSGSEWKSAVERLDAEIAGVPATPAAQDLVPGAVSAGSAAAPKATLDDLSIAGSAASAVASTTRQLNPALRLLNSPSPVVRDLATKTFENSLYLKKNVDGVASEPAVETLAKEWNAGLVKALRGTDEAYEAYWKRGGDLSREAFRDAAGKAMRRADEDSIPEIAAVARGWRTSVFDPLKDAAIDAKILPADVTVETAASYFSRMWNRNKLVAQQGRFRDIVTDWVSDNAPRWARAFDDETAVMLRKAQGELAEVKGQSGVAADRIAELERRVAEIGVERRIERDGRFGDDPTIRGMGREIADEVWNSLTGRGADGVRPEFITVTSRGPLKERTFNIPDHLVEEFLEHDVELVGRRYARVMAADVELAKKFGSPDMKEAIASIRQDYADLRAKTKVEKELRALDEAERADIRDLTGVRDLLRGTYRPHEWDRSFDGIVRKANQLNYIRSMGEVVLASLTDAVRPAMVHGLMPFLGTMSHLATGMKGIRMSVAEAQLGGNVAERVLQSRLASIAELVDPYSSRGPVEAFLENMTNVASKWNGIRIWTDAMKSIAAVMTQDRILKGVGSFADLAKSEKAYLAYLGIDADMAERIAGQFAKHGDKVDGVMVAGTEEWTDAVARRAYRAAMNKDVDSTIVEKSVADVPLFASTPLGKALLQFKSFALASHQKVLLRGLQEDKTRFVGGLAAMASIGMLIVYLKAASSNRLEKLPDIEDNPGWWVAEGIDRSGVLALPFEIANTVEKLVGTNPIKAPIKSWDEGDAQSQRMVNRGKIGALLGPTAGLVEDAATAFGAPITALDPDQDVTKAQRNAAERLLPLNSYVGVRQMLRYLLPEEE